MKGLETSVQELKPWDDITLHISLLNRCTAPESLHIGKLLHSRLRQSGRDRETYVGNHLVQMYGKCGSMSDSLAAFQNIHHRNVYSWNMLLAAYAQNGHLDQARWFFNRSNERNVFTWTIMVAAYAQSGHVLLAWNLFKVMPDRDTPSWNAMISAYAQKGDSTQALELFLSMDLEGVSPNKITFVNMFAAFSSPEVLPAARALHSRMLERKLELDIGVGNCLIGMYGRCGSTGGAESIFRSMSDRDLISWTSLITVYAETDEHAGEAVKTFKLMDLEGVSPNYVTFTSTIEACTRRSDIFHGRILHSLAADSGDDSNVVVATSLINMYGKCGNLSLAREVFYNMPCKNVLTWTSMVAVHAQAGQGSVALEIFSAMGVDGELPTAATFVVVLTSCVHSGKLQEGWSYFVSIVRDYGLQLVPDHFACMVDLLARTGRLDDAQDLINNMPFEPESSALTAYLGSCKTQLDANKGGQVAHQLVELGSHSASPYTLLSSIIRGKTGVT